MSDEGPTGPEGIPGPIGCPKPPDSYFAERARLKAAAKSETDRGTSPLPPITEVLRARSERLSEENKELRTLLRWAADRIPADLRNSPEDSLYYGLTWQILREK